MLSTAEESPGRWVARRDGAVLGRAALFTRPDQRRWLLFRDCAAEAYAALAAAVPGEVFVTVDEPESEAEAESGAGVGSGAEPKSESESESESEDDVRLLLLSCGFAVHRSEHNFLIPTDPARTGLAGVPMPPDITFRSAADVDVDALRRFDDALRQDVPGTDGWRWTPEEFAAETFSPAFDPATYLIAVSSAGDFVGLVRVWWNESGPRLGLIAVVGSHRRSGLAKALLARVFEIAHERGHTHVTAEADVTNVASTTLLESLGGRRVGGSVELVRRAGEVA